MTSAKNWLSAAEAAKALRVSRATLYAYVSRGLVRSEAVPGRSRDRRYSREDVDRLRTRAEQRRDPEKAAAATLQWGLPVLESSISLIANGRLYYRGHDVAGLVRDRSLEEVASLVWTGAFDADFSTTPLHVVSGDTDASALPFIARAQSVLAMVGSSDPLAADLRPLPVAQTGWRILNLLTSVAARSPELEETVEATLARAWDVRSAHATELIRAALVLSADHELNVSSFTARCIASAGSNPYPVVIGALAAMEGSKHGGATVRVEQLWEQLRRKPLEAALSERLRRGEAIEGFGHRLYRDGDPRAIVLMEMLNARLPKSADVIFARDLAGAANAILGEQPTIDFALVALARALKLPQHAALTLFALGRTIGWIGHAIEQYATPGIIRPRAKYVGEMPV